MEAVNLKQGIQVALQICIEETCNEVEETFMQRLSAIFFFFFFFFLVTKNSF